MSVLDKIKELVSSMKEEELEEVLESMSGTKTEPSAQDESEQPQEEESPELDFPEIPEFPDYIECSPEESARALQIRDEIRSVRLMLSDLLIRFESQKNKLIDILAEKEQVFLQELNSIRVNHGVPENQGYTVNIPDGSDQLLTFTKE
jgi:hypothetical protein